MVINLFPCIYISFSGYASYISSSYINKSFKLWQLLSRIQGIIHTQPAASSSESKKWIILKMTYPIIAVTGYIKD